MLALRDLVKVAEETPNSTLDQFHSATSAWQYLQVYELAASYIPAGALVLDWGVGNGHFSAFLVRAGRRPVGFSLDSCEHEAWRPPPPYEFVRGSTEEPNRLPFPDEAFDAVCSIGVLEHVKERGGSPAGSLSELRRVLKRGGVFLCCHLPNRYSLIETAARMVPGKFHHEERFDSTRIRDLLATSGLAPIYMRRYAALPRNLFRRSPAPLRRSERFAAAYSLFDRLAERCAPLFCQNWAVVARRGRTDRVDP